MVSISKYQVETLVDVFRDEIKEYNNSAVKRLENLSSKNRKSLSQKENQFLSAIIREFNTKSFVSCSLGEIDILIKNIGESPKTGKRKFAGKSKHSYLKDEILNCLDYSGMRSNFFPEYFQKLGIKSCVYCNSQLTLTIEREKVKRNQVRHKALFQVDHYYPKEKYPYLSIALYNLYPVCASCNLTKSNNSVDFKLYDEKVKTDTFQFELDKSSKAKFLITRNLMDLKVNFRKVNEPNYVDIFNIKELYATQKDIAEEIILKSLVYDNTYRNNLKEFFKDHRINDNLINRFILGNYSEEKDIHKRPLAKFMQDIGKEVGII